MQEDGHGSGRDAVDEERSVDHGQASRVVARHVRVRGRVQGVFFRAATRQTARRFGVTGWVRNVEDGSLEAWLEGDAGSVDAVETWILSGGPPAAEVEHADVRPVEPEGHDRFQVLR